MLTDGPRMVWVVDILGVFVDLAAERPRNANGEGPRQEGGWVRETFEFPVSEGECEKLRSS
jgi:hypothetical protein